MVLVVSVLLILLTLRNCITSREWVSGVAYLARARWGMFDYDASGMFAAGARTRVPTALILAGKVAATFLVDHTFRTTVWSSSYVIRKASTSWHVAYHAAI